ELVRAAELLGEELVYEGDVVVELAHLEDLLLAEPEAAIPALARRHVSALVPLFSELPLVPALFDVPVQFDAELVRIELPRRRRGHARGVVGVIDDLRGPQRALRHDLRVP